MNKEQIFSIWAPDSSVWSRWAKPVLFAHMDSTRAESPVLKPEYDLSWAPPTCEKTALVLDLTGAEGVQVGVAFAKRGYRPVPLYNAVPLPFDELSTGPAVGPDVAAVNVFPIIGALRQGTGEIAALNLASNAPPVFLLDGGRSGTGREMEPDEFDNRSICFTTDFPSANFLAAQGVERVILLQKHTLEPHMDLAHVLRRWQDGGLRLERKRIELPDPPQSFTVPRPSWYGAMFQRALASLGLRRAPVGGFGAWVPESSAGG